jgi:hypothetical protein
VNAPVIDRRIVTVGERGDLIIEASDAQLAGFPPLLSIPQRDGSPLTFVKQSIVRDRDNDITHARYTASVRVSNAHVKTITLIVIND